MPIKLKVKGEDTIKNSLKRIVESLFITKGGEEEMEIEQDSVRSQTKVNEETKVEKQREKLD